MAGADEGAADGSARAPGLALVATYFVSSISRVATGDEGHIGLAQVRVQ
ncbi:MAG: hypothetical protein ABIP53_10165 [Candidatus Limnocylindrales bacterium]